MADLVVAGIAGFMAGLLVAFVAWLLVAKQPKSRSAAEAEFREWVKGRLEYRCDGIKGQSEKDRQASRELKQALRAFDNYISSSREQLSRLTLEMKSKRRGYRMIEVPDDWDFGAMYILDIFISRAEKIMRE